jgi:hypothetical protein
MLQMLQDVLIAFQRFTTARGDFVQHECNMDGARWGLAGGGHLPSCRRAITHPERALQRPVYLDGPKCLYRDLALARLGVKQFARATDLLR